MSATREVAERLRKRRPLEKYTTDEGPVWLRGLSGKERQSYMHAWGDKAGVDVLPADQHLVALALVDESGNPLFDSFEEAFEVLLDWSIPDVGPAAKIILRLSGLAEDSSEKAEKKS